MSDSEKKSETATSDCGGRAFGKYRIINVDEMPRLHEGEDDAENEAAVSAETREAEERRDLPRRRLRDLEDGIRRVAPENDEASGRRERRGILGRRPRDDYKEARGEAPADVETSRPKERRGILRRRPRNDSEEARGGAPAHVEAPGPDEPRGVLRRRLRDIEEGARRVAPERAERPEPEERSKSARKTQEEIPKNRGGTQKGSCPSWLKSRVYKGGRPSKDDKGLLELQELIIRHSPVGTAVLDNRGKVRIRNESFMDLLGLSSNDSIEDIDDLAQLIEGVNLSDRFWAAVETGSKVELEDEVRIEGSTNEFLQMKFHPVSLPSGVSWCIFYLNTISDGFDPVGGPYEYQNYVAHLAASSGDAIVGLDNSGNIKYWNQGAQALFGYTEDEILGKSAKILVPEELRREAQLVLRVVLEKGTYKNFDTRRITKSGEQIPVTMTVSVVRDDDGNIIGTAATCKDLRGTKDLHEKAMEAEKLNAVLQMAVSVYHQINNPLCVIAANTQLLLPRLDSESKDEIKRLEIILDATKRISRVLEDLTQLTGVEPRTTSFRDGKKPAGSKSR